MAKKIVKRKKSNAPPSVLAKNRRQLKWRDTMTFLYKNTTIATQQYMDFEKNHLEKFKEILSGHETSLKDLALIVNRSKISSLAPKPAPQTLKEFNDQKPKKLTKKGRILEKKNGPGLKPLPKPTLETALMENEETVSLEKYLDIMNRLFTISSIANDFNKQLGKFPDECQEKMVSDEGLPGIGGTSTVGDLSNNGDKLIAYWRGLTGNRSFKVFEQGSVDWAVPGLLTMNEENEMIKEKWRHLARTVLRLAQNFVQYATQKTGIIINDSEQSINGMRIGLTHEQIELMDRLTEVLLISPVSNENVGEAHDLLAQFSMKHSKKPEKEEIPGRSDKCTLFLPDEAPPVGVKKKKKGGKKKSKSYSPSKVKK